MGMAGEDRHRRTGRPAGAVDGGAAKSSVQTQRLHPLGLADALDLWALRREKILPLLDVRAARAARRLADSCRALARTERQAGVAMDAWESDWRAVREQAVGLLDGSLTGGRSSTPPRASRLPSTLPPAEDSPIDLKRRR